MPDQGGHSHQRDGTAQGEPGGDDLAAEIGVFLDRHQAQANWKRPNRLVVHGWRQAGQHAGRQDDQQPDHGLACDAAAQSPARGFRRIARESGREPEAVARSNSEQGREQ
jgi:hypothetical protein